MVQTRDASDQSHEDSGQSETPTAPHRCTSCVHESPPSIHQLVCPLPLLPYGLSKIKVEAGVLEENILIAYKGSLA
ncbi:hypothetical protein AMEX_G6131 [Astyanax mexicanus]|uniref:Uncharacterized protein n=1 Tax=Astyanax mexicanus TaxID=7994 RepID=A0A8T2M5C5_ASTMX|nr:hypothetical protein AMEX_G6131 [Astyanax mexicanus]